MPRVRLNVFVARFMIFQGMSLRNTVFRSKASLGLISSGNYFPFLSQFFPGWFDVVVYGARGAP
jgi:hypothetical protein